MRLRGVFALAAVLVVALAATAAADVLVIGGVPSKVKVGQRFTIQLNGSPFTPPATLTVFLAAKRCAKDSATEKASGAKQVIAQTYQKAFKRRLRIHATAVGRRFICGYFGDSSVSSRYTVTRH